jgi:hypothetical protein
MRSDQSQKRGERRCSKKVSGFNRHDVKSSDGMEVHSSRHSAKRSRIESTAV